MREGDKSIPHKRRGFDKRTEDSMHMHHLELLSAFYWVDPKVQVRP